MTTLHLLSSIALPVLTYGLESLSMAKTKLVELDHPWLRSCMKIFKTFDKQIVRQCQMFAGVLPLQHHYALRSCAFLLKLESSDNGILRLLYDMCVYRDIVSLSLKYNCATNLFIKNYRSIISTRFHDECNMTNQFL